MTEWKYRRFIMSLGGLTLLFLVGRLLELPLMKTITGTFVIHLNVNAANKTSNATILVAEDIFTKAAERQELRKMQLTNYCTKHMAHVENYKLPKKERLGQLLVDDDNNYIYCAVPKSASTAMKGTLLNLRNDSDKIQKWSVHSPSLWKHMSEYKTTENLKRLATHFKFLFVREPFHRFLSAYKDKFWGGNRIYTNGYRRIIVQALRPQDVEPTGTAANNVTFTEFLKYIVTYPDYFTSRDDHWRQYEHLCFPCTIEYDFIGQFETLADDAAYLLKMAGIDDRVVFPPVRSSQADTDFLTYYSQVPHELIFKFREAFRNDFEMFGYSFPGPLKDVLTNYTFIAR